MPSRTPIGQGSPAPGGHRGQPGGRAGAAAGPGRALPLLGLVGACLIGFLAGAATGLLAPPPLPEEEAGAEQGAETRKTGIGAFALSALTSAAVPRQIILVMGRDVSYQDGRPVDQGPARSDTMMVVGVDPPARRLAILSVPRDTRCDIPGHGVDKINAALALGGPQLAMQTVSNLLGVPIDHWILLKIDGLIRMVDLVGGVDLEVREHMRYTDRSAGLRIRLKKGFQHLDGEKAHEFVRFRHDNQGDIGRIARQQAFVQAVTRKLLSPRAVLAVPQLIQALQQNVETDLDAAQLAAMAAWARSLAPGQIRMAMLSGEFSSGLRASYWLVDVKRARRLASRLLLGQTPAPPPDAPDARGNIHVAILNGTSRPRLASEAARILRTEGWTVWLIGDADRRDHAESHILADSGDDAVAGAISRTLNLNAPLEGLPVGTNLPLTREDIDYVVILGEDFIRALRVPLPERERFGGQGG